MVSQQSTEVSVPLSSPIIIYALCHKNAIRNRKVLVFVDMIRKSYHTTQITLSDRETRLQLLKLNDESDQTHVVVQIQNVLNVKDQSLMIYDSCIIYEKTLNQHQVSFHYVGISKIMLQVTPVKKKIHRHKLLKVNKGFRIK